VAKQSFAPQVLTANRLRAGDVVYLAGNEDWVAELGKAAVATDAQQLQVLEAAAALAVGRQQVVGVYAIDVDTRAGAPAPLSVKERIRAARGPSV